MVEGYWLTLCWELLLWWSWLLTGNVLAEYVRTVESESVGVVWFWNEQAVLYNLRNTAPSAAPCWTIVSNSITYNNDTILMSWKYKTGNLNVVETNPAWLVS